MKKEYKKPIIIVESFEISEHIAGCKGVQHTNPHGNPQQWSKTSCSWYVKGEVVFMEGMDVCITKLSKDGEFQPICYNSPNGDVVIFGS